jgi:Family of unknown function (DUF6214)
MVRYRSDERAGLPAYQDALLWPDARTGPWLVTVTWANIGGREEPAGLEIRGYREEDAWPRVLPARDKGPAVLATTTLREIPFATIVADLRRQRAEQHAGFIDFLAAGPEYQAEADQAALRRLRAAGPRPTAAVLAEVAEVYRQAWKDGQPPTRAVAAHFTISQSAAAKRVARARQAGYLPPTSQGRPEAWRQEGTAPNEGEEPR